jgi:oligopeptidase B
VALRAHGHERIDDWYWLRERDNPEVLAHLEAENAYTAAMTEHLEPLREELYAEIVARIQETDLSVPVTKGSFAYYARTVEGEQYPIHCRRPAGDRDLPGAGLEDPGPGDPAALAPDEQVLLDENRQAAGHDYFSLGSYAISPDHRLLAYGTDTTGAERFRLRVRDLQTGADLPEAIDDTYYSLAWANDSTTLFYVRPDQANRPYQLWRHRVGTPAESDTCLYTEEDERFFVAVGSTKDERYVVLQLSSQVTSEIRLLDADRPLGSFSVVEPRRDGVEYGVEHHGGRLLVVTNDQAKNFRLLEAAAGGGSPRPAEELLPYDPSVRLLGIDVFARYLVLYERAGGLRRIRVADLGDGGAEDPVRTPSPEGTPSPGGAGPGAAPRLGPLDPARLHVIEQPEAVSTAWGGPNPEFSSQVLRYEYTSLVTPRSVYDYDLSTRRATLRKRQPVRGGYDPSCYRTERAWAEGLDGAAVPVSLVYREGIERDGSAPALLYGYGAYEASVDPAFSSLRLSLLDRGFVVAVAHVRGGGELGRPWYEDGKLLRKRNTFFDFIACGRHLVEEGWTSTERLVARGGRAGGMRMGVVANEAPSLFRAIVAEVPFVDCLTTMLDDTLPLTVTEWEEWGNPKDDPEAYAYMKSYSPYDNVAAQHYPRLLVTGGLNDPRVGYWEPAKWVAKLRSLSPDSQVLFKCELGSGHAGPSGRYHAWEEEAFVLSFILDAVGLAGPGPQDRARPPGGAGPAR